MAKVSKFFSEDELKCQHCGEYQYDSNFLDLLDSIRMELGVPMRVSSGYRCPSHPIEAAKSQPGVHSTGMAVDILCYGAEALDLVRVAQAHGISRIGVNQKGDLAQRFVHLDICDDKPRPAFWSY
jgi:uncharacterized protein YcbK (DUF882 family)